ncbi:MAG TPA: hypothetical protein VFS37_15065, partial [Conexibacter sp.]|nr:hypothetical protein [Conexibacter sp.]
MASAASQAAAASRRGSALTSTSRTVDAATAAWLCALPVAATVAASILLLGPVVGGPLRPSASFTFLPQSEGAVYDESTEHARYLIALTGPLLLALATWWAVRRRVALPPRVASIGTTLAQLALAAVLVACVVYQYGITYGPVYTRTVGVVTTDRYFNPATLVVAGAVAVALLLAARSVHARQLYAAVARESPTRRWTLLAVAVLLTATWLLHAVNSDASIASVPEAIRYHLEFTLDEAFAVTNGLTPLVDFNPQYSALWPFGSALVMQVAGESLLVFSIALSALTAISLLAIYGVLRRVTGSSASALLLYVPFLATSMFVIGAVTVNRGSFGNYFGVFPLRYAGPYLLAWLTARRLERGGGAVGLWLLFSAAGLVLINNADFGVPALGACVAALLWTGAVRGRLRTLALSLVAGLATAAALVVLLTLVRAGSLPQPGRIFEYARVYTRGGYTMLPMPPFGVHVALYLTYVGALGVATVRALRGARDRVLTGMLAWSAIFGLGAASYYVGRSHPEALRAMFSAWALALVLLAVAALRALSTRPAPRRPIVIAVALFGFGIAVCSIAQLPAPWSQLRRIEAGFVPG